MTCPEVILFHSSAKRVPGMKSLLNATLPQPISLCIRFQKAIVARRRGFHTISTFHNPSLFIQPVKPPRLSVSLFGVSAVSECEKGRSFRTAASLTKQGEIHVILGPMFAGKTTTLLQRIKAESVNGRSIAIIKSDKDNRYGMDSVVTHNGERMPCWPLLEVIGIDEAQFFKDLYEFCSKAADHDGKTVIVSGLDGDYLRRRFGSVLDIIPIADTVTKLTARCGLCGDHAHFTLRKTDETKTELIAGADVYMPVCRKHYVSGQVLKEATRDCVLEAQEVECIPFCDTAAVVV
ncbi:unnamed protein product [Cuscuta epithymum]|uniref:Thymidine kinase n=1 Tax=Cuscuta epithymum TaxID=186058 RepID=A0AAV0DXT8_9ASTE|nr:unnamed protein product [Cuscuta epithymum]CAH9133806.1 unnamed protein product [Cuscuta epithymum]